MINDNNLLNNNNKREPKNSPARLKANKKYDKLHYKAITSKVKIDEMSQINDYASKNNMSISKLICNCIKYCMQNDVKFNEWYMLFCA